MKYLIYIIGITVGSFFYTKGYAQEKFNVMFYNVENLFDCFHDTLKNDREFLPDSPRAWHMGRYKTKINHIAKTITAAGGWHAPVLVGLCEVENEKVMDDLTRYSPLKEIGYRYVITRSPDERGIDVALLYQRGSFSMIGNQSIKVKFVRKKSLKPTRDILHVWGKIANNDTLDVFVVHFPSRSGGEKESEPARLQAASILKFHTDSLFAIRRHPNLIVMGDFNDYPENRSISEILNAKAPEEVSVSNNKLYNLMDGKKGGTYKYQGKWGILDQFIVSGFLLQNRKGLHTSPSGTHICELSFLLEKDEKYGGVRPFRTYYGFKYTGGFSDHLPIITEFELP